MVSVDARGYEVPEGVEIRGRYDEEFASILSKDALQFVVDLQREFMKDIEHAMDCRKEAQVRYNNGELPGFDPATKYVREAEWACAAVPPAVADRRVEITGPVDRKMVINALNSEAKVFMADFEDAVSASWEKVVRGQVNLRDAMSGTIMFHEEGSDTVYKLNQRIATLFVRPRGCHLPESHILIDGRPAAACLVDFGLYFFHNCSIFRQTQGQGFGPFFYLPQMEHSREARIWNRVFEKAEKVAGIDRGSIRATVLIETLPAAFQMDEILHELKDHSDGLNCGRWDHISSYVKAFEAHPGRLLPDRIQLSNLLIRTCHRRGVHAMGGMAGQIPIKDDPEAGVELVRKEKQREVEAGHDGTWAAHLGLIPGIMEVFEGRMGGRANQIHGVAMEPRGVGSVEGLRLNTRVGIQYLAAWLTVPLYGLMEDGEISRVQMWRWLKYGADLDGDRLGFKLTPSLFHRVVAEEMARIRSEVGNDRFRSGMYEEACKIFTRECLEDFLTLDANRKIRVPVVVKSEDV
ncbi:malate synthase, glyoxysomal-like [Salvia miltiorrhiza]|uniref:malate synthase, glyoxysomal-like n=1 Tax=Salvia miltiorrhiza TaxID=226208 RepID=UPI0025AB671F|nr:malate synthase, glyoxysomal-like [Salvia miltiorrhiza]